ncbi:MAG: membrane dipeptidase [Kofleriaceae bacterium]|nr:dipeptidase [Myxococcales bacterium]MCB9571985.1 membrane dipeptidase [Kofleriaceae bacterium]
MAELPLDVVDARALHGEVCVLDLHADTPKLMDKLGFDISVAHDRPMPGRLNYVGHVDLPRLREGGMAGQFFGLWTVPYPERGCAASVHAQLDAVDRAIARHPEQLGWAMTSAQIRAAKAAGKIAVLGGIEGGQALEADPRKVEVFAARGVRYVGLMHFSANALGAPARGRGADPDRGLSPIGVEVIREMNRCGVVVDLAHINRKGFFEALAVSTQPPMVTHTGVAGVHAHWRNIDDAQIRAVADAGGCIGIIFAKRFLGGRSLEAVVDHLVHVIEIGGEDVPALGSDFDGFVVPPVGLEDVACMPNLTAALSRRGVPVRVLEKILGGNVLRVLDGVPPVTYQAAHPEAST